MSTTPEQKSPIEHLLASRTASIDHVQKAAKQFREMAEIYAVEFAEQPDDKDKRKYATEAAQANIAARRMCEASITAIDGLFATAKYLLETKK